MATVVLKLQPADLRNQLDFRLFEFVNICLVCLINDMQLVTWNVGRCDYPIPVSYMTLLLAYL